MNKKEENYIVRDGRVIQWDLYKQYLRSKVWIDKTKRIKEKNGFRCERCGSDRTLRTHHKTYKNVYNEKDEDLECICNKCHYIEHNPPEDDEPFIEDDLEKHGIPTDYSNANYPDFKQQVGWQNEGIGIVIALDIKKSFNTLSYIIHETVGKCKIKTEQVSIKEMAKRIGASESTISREVKWLKENEYINVIENEKPYRYSLKYSILLKNYKNLFFIIEKDKKYIKIKT